AAEAGDLNSDGSVSVADLTLLRQFLLKQAEPDGSVSFDVNGDGNVNVFDFTALKRTLLSSTPVEPVDPVDPVEPEDNTITLADSGITYTGVGMTLSEDEKIITISQPGTYIVTGEMTGGQIVVDVDKTTYAGGIVELSLEGMSLTNETDSPIYVASIDEECVITAKKGTENTVADGSSYTNADEDSGAIYSKDDLKFKGKGTLNVIGNCADGIVSKNDIKIHNGTINVTAVDDGIRGKDSVKIGDADDTDFSNLNVTVNAKGGDGIKSTETDTTSGKGYITSNGGTVNITALSDGLHASQTVTLNGGDFTIKTTGSSSTTSDISAKGIKAGCTDDTTGEEITGTITINGGTYDVDSTDDCVHASGNIDLVGGVLELNSGDDAVHSDADLTIGHGDNTFDDLTVIVEACYEGMEGMNVTQNSGTVIINSTDDGYNAAGGADGSGSTTPGGWGGPGGSTTTGGSYTLTINGGFALVNATDGDHDGFDSNGSLTINGGYAISNGNEPFDCDGTLSYTGGVYVSEAGSSGGMGGMGGMGGSSSMTQSVSASVSANAGTRITICDESGNVIVSFIADKNATTITAGCTAYSGATVYTGGELSGSTYFQTVDDTQLAAYGGTLTGGTAAGSSSSGGTTNPWG
ncbi:MAG: carbohydrate-binding domain-containing protein, partial [Porcipelethomonas sp.]